jgi:hypothetical protein
VIEKVLKVTHYQLLFLADFRITPVILATQEAEIRRIVVRSQPRQKGLVEWLKV